MKKDKGNLPSDPWITPGPSLRSTHFIFKQQATYVWKNSGILGDIISEDEQESEYNQELEFSPFGIFFKANTIIYQQNQTIDIQRVFNKKDLEAFMKESNENTITFDNFLVVKGCKLLISYTIRPILINLFFEPFSNVRDILNKLPLSKKKKAASAGTNTFQKSSRSKKKGHNGAGVFLGDSIEETDKIYKLGIRVETPQFNLNDYSSRIQILFASKRECMVTFKTSLLRFDAFQQDPRHSINVNFKDVELFTINPLINPENNIYWLEDGGSTPDYTLSSSSEHNDENSESEELSGSRSKSIISNKRGFNIEEMGSFKSSMSISSRSLGKVLNLGKKTESKFGATMTKKHAEPSIESNLQNRMYYSNTKNHSIREIFPLEKQSHTFARQSNTLHRRPPNTQPSMLNASQLFKRKGVLTPIIHCDTASASYIYYRLGECPIDFSQQVYIPGRNGMDGIRQQDDPFLWNRQQRINRAMVDVGFFNSQMSDQDFEIFLQMNTFIMALISIDQFDTLGKMHNETINRRMLAELKSTGIDGMIKYLQQRIQERMGETRIGALSRIRSTFEYSFTKVILKMNIVQGEQEVMKVIINNCHGLHTSKMDGMKEIKFGIQDFVIDNPQVKEGENNRVLRRIEEGLSSESEAIVVTQQYFTVEGQDLEDEVIKGDIAELGLIQSSRNIWKVVNNFEIIVAPMVVNVTKKIYFQLQEYFFARENKRASQGIFEDDLDFQRLYLENQDLYFKLREQKQKQMSGENNQNSQEDLRLYEESHIRNETVLATHNAGSPIDKQKNTHQDMQVAPTFYRKIKVNSLKLVVTFKSDRIFLNCNRMKMFIDPFVKNQKLYTRKILFDRIQKHAVKNALVPIMKHKILGVKAKNIKSSDEQKNEEKDFLKKRRMLLGAD